MMAKTESTLPTEYSLVALTDPKFAQVLVREAKRATKVRKRS